MFLNEEFEQSPLKFLKKYPLDTGDLSPSMPSNLDDIKEVLSPGVTKLYFGDKANGQGIRNPKFAAVLTPFRLELGEGNGVELKVERDETEWSVDAYYLPWKTLMVTSMVLPKDCEGRYFFTASLSGCSVFVRGNAENPTVCHAGSEPKALNDATDLWKACLRKMGEDHATPRFYGIDKYDYRKQGPRGGLKRDTSMEEAVFSHNFRFHRELSVVQSSGCVVGVKDADNGKWDFYLQERTRYSILELHNNRSHEYWTPVSVRRFFPTGAKQVQMLDRVQFA